ncbi:MAG: response regulator [Bacteriovorax sp.]|jgi:DNA-binding response OmpR family regulator
MNDKKQTVGDVLIVDDDPAICELLKNYCDKMGCFRHVLIANDGSIASIKMRNQKFAVIMIDLKLPKKSGIDLIRELNEKSTNRKNSILVVSGTIVQTDLEKLIELGIRNFLPKPFEEVVFQERVLKLLAVK